MIDQVLNSTVVAAAVTGGFALVGSVVLYLMSKSKKPKWYLGRRRLHEDSLTYSGYERLLKQNAIEMERLYAVAQDREGLISLMRQKEELMRKKEDELYEVIRSKDEEISRLVHYHKMHEATLRGEKPPKKLGSDTMDA